MTVGLTGRSAGARGDADLTDSNAANGQSPGNDPFSQANSRRGGDRSVHAAEVVHALAGHKLNHDQDDYLAIMAKLVEDYESENVPEPKPVKGIETLKFLLEENGLTATDLGDIIGVNRSIAYRILKGARNLTADHIKKLVTRFAVSADLFLA